MIRYIQAILLLFTVLMARSQPRTDSFLLHLLLRSHKPILEQVIKDPDPYRVQIIYTQINRDQYNRPQFTNYYFHFDPDLYFNPASMVKMPLAFLSLEKINHLHISGLTKDTPMQFDSSFAGQRALLRDSTSKRSIPSIGHFIKRAFLISENDPYNRMYQFVGQGEINRNLHQKGYRDVRITRQFMGLTPEQNRHTNAIRFLRPDGTLLWQQPPAFNTDTFDFSRKVFLGKGYLNRMDSLVNEPFDFTMHNNISLLDFQQMLQSVLFPASVSKQQRFYLTGEDYRFLYQYLSQYPSETPYPKYDTVHFYDSYVKFFFQDSTHKLPPNIRVFNKVGWAYGFSTDVSYVVDFKNNVEFMLATTIYTNSDGILNDNKYDYSTIALPFTNQLGQTIYQYELKRKRKIRPDLSRFRINYEKRDPQDTRPSLTEVDN